MQGDRDASIQVALCYKRGQIGECIYFSTPRGTQGRVQTVSAAEVVQSCWSALFVAELHKGGVISFRITHRVERGPTRCADWFSRMETLTFIVCEEQSKHHKIMMLQHPGGRDIIIILWAQVFLSLYYRRRRITSLNTPKTDITVRH